MLHLARQHRQGISSKCTIHQNDRTEETLNYALNRILRNRRCREFLKCPSELHRRASHDGSLSLALPNASLPVPAFPLGTDAAGATSYPPTSHECSLAIAT